MTVHRRRWFCRFPGCGDWGYLTPDQDGALAVIAHHQAQHQPSEDST